MIDIKHLDNTTELDQPRRIRKYVLVCCSSGSAVLVVDENEFVLKANSVITITSGQVHYMKTKKAPKGFVLEFTYDFFCKNDADIELIFHNSLFCHFALNEIIPLGHSQLVGSELKQIEKELTETPYQYVISIHSPFPQIPRSHKGQLQEQTLRPANRCIPEGRPRTSCTA
jgi:AraC family transcriptional activator of pobA